MFQVVTVPGAAVFAAVVAEVVMVALFLSHSWMRSPDIRCNNYFAAKKLIRPAAAKA